MQKKRVEADDDNDDDDNDDDGDNDDDDYLELKSDNEIDLKTGTIKSN